MNPSRKKLCFADFCDCRRNSTRSQDDLIRITGRPHQDRRDFIRRRVYQKNGPENGLSVFRRLMYPTNQSFYARIASKKPVGASECKLGDLIKKGIRTVVTGSDKEHISLRCPDCDMASKPGICKPVKGASFDDCPFFDNGDPLDLNGAFIESEAPRKQTPAPKAVREGK